MTRITPLILAVALFMEQMDSTVIATSLPAIAADIGTSPVALKLAVTSYLVALAIFIPISGWMSDRFGAKNIFRVAIVVFVLGSIACGFSGSIHAFVLSRFLQGIGGSMMTPVGRLLLVRGTPRNELVSAMAWLTIPALIGPIIGPPLGGFLTTYLSWHWVFWINVPIGILGLALVTRFLPAGGPQVPRPVDLPGLPALQHRLRRLRLRHVGGQPAGAADGLRLRHHRRRRSPPALLYLRHARRAAFPLLDPKMLRYPLFRAGIIGGSIFRIGIGAIPFLLPLMLQLGFGLNPFQSGLDHLRHRGRGAVVEVRRAVGVPQLRLPQRARHRRADLGAVHRGQRLLHPDDAGGGDHGLFLLLGGVLRSICFTGVNAMVFSDIDDADSSQATAINSVAQQNLARDRRGARRRHARLAGQFHGGGLDAARLPHRLPASSRWSPGSRRSPSSACRADAGAAVSGHRRRPALANP